MTSAAFVRAAASVSASASGCKDVVRSDEGARVRSCGCDQGGIPLAYSTGGSGVTRFRYKCYPAVKQRLEEAIQALVRIRDALIQARPPGNDHGDWLPRTNAILSAICGTEFPFGGPSVERIAESRDALRQLLAA